MRKMGSSNNLSQARLGKRLAYILRYGAMKEGLTVHSGGYVSLQDVMGLELMKYHSEKEVMDELLSSQTVRGVNRFQVKEERNVSPLVRATYGRFMEPHRQHPHSNARRLLEICLDYVCKNIKAYDLENFPDGYLLRRMFYRLKFEKRLTNAALRSLLSSSIDHLDFSGVFITESTIRLISQRCTTLKSISFKGCGYVVTDTLMAVLFKSLKYLQGINLCDCKSITDKTLASIAKNKTPLCQLNVSYCPKLTVPGLQKFVSLCPSLEELFIQGGIVDDNVCSNLQTIHHIARYQQDSNSSANHSVTHSVSDPSQAQEIVKYNGNACEGFEPNSTNMSLKIYFKTAASDMYESNIDYERLNQLIVEEFGTFSLDHFQMDDSDFWSLAEI